MKKNLQLFMAVLTIFCIVPAGFAEDSANFGENVPTVEDVVVSLAGAERSIAPKAISMEIRFEKNSFQLTPKAKETLSVVGEALNTPLLKEGAFVIEGHTDASGSDEYNIELSQKRAKAVKDFLVTQTHVESDRLKTEGKGENELLLKDQPLSAKNRRVQIKTVK